MDNQHIPPSSWTPTPPPIPPSLPATPAPLGSDPVERTPIHGWSTAVEAVLRQPRRVWFQLTEPGRSQLTLTLIGIAVLSALCYGLVVGTFSRGDQLWAAPVKIACGLLLSALICLPSLYIFSCLSGARTRLSEVCGLVAGLLALMTILLIGFAPVAWVFSQSTESVPAMSALHFAFAVIAVGFGLRFMSRGFAQLNADTAGGLKTWSIIFVLVLLQMTTALRPIVGTADTFLPEKKQFFLQHWAEELRIENRAQARTP